MPLRGEAAGLEKHAGLKRALAIDPERATRTIAEFIRDKVKERGKEGVALGLSGGVDSCLVAYLAVKALEDPLKVHALYMPDRDSDRRFEAYAREVAHRLGLVFRKVVITQEAGREGAYRAAIRVMRALPFFNRLIVRGSNRFICPLLSKRLLYVATLEGGTSVASPLSKLLCKEAAAVEESFSIRHRIRRKILEEYAKSHNLLAVGCANRSEFFVGWFVKDGIDDLPIEPLLGLYKSQVWQLARSLGVPERIIKAPPSPDMFKGMTDEDGIGYSYGKIDKVAYVLEHDLPRSAALSEGVTPREFEEIETIHRLSAWKRENLHEFPSLD